MLLGGSLPGSGHANPLPCMHCPREVSFASIFFSVSPVTSRMKCQECFSSDLKKNSQDKKRPGSCLFLSVDKLTTEMQTAGTSKAPENQQLQKMLHFLQSLVRRGEAGKGQFGSGKATRARETEEQSFQKTLRKM